MGTKGNLAVYGDSSNRSAALVLNRLADLEGRWSRFRPDSEISRINAAQGEPVTVGPDTMMLLSLAVQAWRRTGGLFDPTVGAAMIAHGYDRDFASLGGRRNPEVTEVTAGCSGIQLDIARGRVRVPSGITLDPGGIGKGLAADIVVAEALARGCTGVLVNIGGDMRMAGSPPDGDWVVAVEDPRRPGDEWLRWCLTGGAVATSSTLRRRWQQGDVTCHHVIDPQTGAPATGATVAVTTVAQTAWWAEVVATSLLLSEEPDDAPLAATVEYVALRSDGAVRSSAGMAAVVAA